MKIKITKMRKELEKIYDTVPDIEEDMLRHLTKAIGSLLRIESEIKERKLNEIRNMKTINISPEEFSNLAEHVDEITDKLNTFNEAQMSNFQKEVERLKKTEGRECRIVCSNALTSCK